jgi:hypothetical protein
VKAGRTKNVRSLTGFVDAYGIITYDSCLSFMSGNTTQTGYRAAPFDRTTTAAV